MGAKSFVKLLRKVIREEVQDVVRKEIRTLLEEQTINHKEVINHGMQLSEMSKNSKRSKKTFTKNNMLNDLLNETAASADFSSMRQGPLVTQEEYPTMNFKSSMAESFGMSRQPQPLATTGINGEAINMQNENVAKTLDIMTKDYSGLMKKMKEQDKSKGKKVV